MNGPQYFCHNHKLGNSKGFGGMECKGVLIVTTPQMFTGLFSSYSFLVTMNHITAAKEQITTENCQELNTIYPSKCHVTYVCHTVYNKMKGLNLLILSKMTQ